MTGAPGRGRGRERGARTKRPGILALLALLACAAAGEACFTRPVAPPPLYPPLLVEGAGTGSFEAVAGWGPLRWDMTSEAALAALGAARIPARSDETRGYFSEPAAPGDPSGAGPAAGPVSHTTSPQIVVEREGWSGTVYFNELDQMTEVSLQSPALYDRADALALLDELQVRYGVPEELSKDSTSASYTWRNRWTVLEAKGWSSQGGLRWVVTARFLPAAQATPAPAAPAPAPSPETPAHGPGGLEI